VFLTDFSAKRVTVPASRADLKVGRYDGVVRIAHGDCTDWPQAGVSG
jgi:hypothetical protein